MPALLRNKRFWIYSVSFLIVAVLLWPGEPSMNRGGIQSHAGKLGLSPSILDEADLLCSGHFSTGWNPSSWTSRVVIEVPYGKVLALRKVVSFHVDHYWKGSGPAEINIAFFQPTERAWGESWFFPARENLLLALNKDVTGSGAYRLVHQTNSWLVLRGGTGPNESLPEKEVARVAQAYLAAYIAGTEEKTPVVLMEPVRVGALLPGEMCVDNNAVIAQTLATLAEFQINDANTMAMVKKLLTMPMSPTVEDEAIRALMKLAPKEGWEFGYDLYESNSTGQQEVLVLSMALPKGITIETLPLLDFAKIEKLMGQSPRLKKDIAQALREVKDKRALPFFEELLGDPDNEMRYAGMHGIYGICGGRKAGYIFPAYRLFLANPEGYLAPYKAWCAQQHAAP